MIFQATLQTDKTKSGYHRIGQLSAESPNAAASKALVFYLRNSPPADLVDDSRLAITSTIGFYIFSVSAAGRIAGPIEIYPGA